MFEFTPLFVLYFTEEGIAFQQNRVEHILSGTFIWIQGVIKQLGYFYAQIGRKLYLYFSLNENVFSFYGDSYTGITPEINIPYNELNQKYCYLGAG